MLVSLYQLLTSGNLVVLETLKIAHCKSLKHIIADERRKDVDGEDDDDDDDGNLGSMFPKLKVLD
ncbi:disease resistance protein, partial [Trifolium medium]|nr:disease resistance protein [Trifolium medium]